MRSVNGKPSITLKHGRKYCCLKSRKRVHKVAKIFTLEMNIILISYESIDGRIEVGGLYSSALGDLTRIFILLLSEDSLFCCFSYGT